MAHMQFPDTAPLWHPRFVATLPFNPDDVSRWRTEKVLERTRKHWAWFSSVEGQQLGTFGHLPFEVREIILEFALHCRPTRSLDGLWEYDSKNGSAFNLSAYYFGFGRRNVIDPSMVNLRLASAAIRFEYDQVFLSKRDFRFNEVDTFLSFFKQVKEVPSVTIGVNALYKVELWADAVSKLPSSLRKLEIQIHVMLPFHRQYLRQQGLVDIRRFVENACQAVPNARVSITGAGKSALPEDCQGIADEFHLLSGGATDQSQVLSDVYVDPYAQHWHQALCLPGYTVNRHGH